MNISTFQSRMHTFLKALHHALIEVNLDVSTFVLDHVCWRCESENDYQEMLTLLMQNASLFHQSVYNGREISLLQLNQAISYEGRSIDMIELPAPKEGKPYANGFEHAEFVVPDSLHSWYKAFPLDWDTKNINKEINPDVRLSFGSMSVKFHPYSLAYVVKHLE